MAEKLAEDATPLTCSSDAVPSEVAAIPAVSAVAVFLVLVRRVRLAREVVALAASGADSAAAESNPVLSKSATLHLPLLLSVSVAEARPRRPWSFASVYEPLTERTSVLR